MSWKNLKKALFTGGSASLRVGDRVGRASSPFRAVVVAAHRQGRRLEALVRVGADAGDVGRVEDAVAVAVASDVGDPRAAEPALERGDGNTDGFRGAGVQVPPMYSALKHQGQRLYNLARKGIEVERQARPIAIYALRLLGFDATSLVLDVHCSKGTYIRTLAEDIGRVLGCGGHVEMLRRTALGALDVGAACTMDRLAALTEEGREALLLPIDTLVAHLPAVELNEEMSIQASHGNPLFVPQAPVQGCVRLYGRLAGFLGLGEVLEDGRIGPRRMLRNP